MKRLEPEADRLIADFQHGHKMGERSTLRLLELVRSMAQHIEDLEHDRRRP